MWELETVPFGCDKISKDRMPQAIDVRLDALTGVLPGQQGSMLHSTRAGSEEKTFYIETFGCQMNAHDSEKVAGVLMSRGYEQVERSTDAKVIFYNTCSIREKAAQKVFSRLGTLRELAESGAIIGVLGCVAQQEGEEIFERAPWVNLVCGSASYRKLPELIAELEAGNRRVTGLDKDTDETFETEMTRRDNPFRAYLTIIEGCDKSCSYCVVPYTRGPERSSASGAILREVRQLADAGYSEVQLLGQTVNSYRDPSKRKMSFANLLAEVAAVERIRRVRFTTSHPRDFGPDIVNAIDAVPAVCNHIHLPVQSGSNRILHEMRRTYSREEYLEKIAMTRSTRREISVTTDVIVGFPGETDADFEQTLSLMDEAQYDAIFAFQYSPRPNTSASAMPDAVPEDEKARRLAVLMDRQRNIQLARNEAMVGRKFEVLVDGAARKVGQWMGRTSCNRILNFTSPRSELLGEYVSVRVLRAAPNSLAGEQVI
jgi:tRNA-2-methylthio-N6-dimethylallyladenosine synthase